MILYDKKVLATVDVLYWMPDYQDILQQICMANCRYKT